MRHSEVRVIDWSPVLDVVSDFVVREQDSGGAMRESVDNDLWNLDVPLHNHLPYPRPMDQVVTSLYGSLAPIWFHIADTIGERP